MQLVSAILIPPSRTPLSFQPEQSLLMDDFSPKPPPLFPPSRRRGRLPKFMKSFLLRTCRPSPLLKHGFARSPLPLPLFFLSLFQLPVAVSLPTDYERIIPALYGGHLQSGLSLSKPFPHQLFSGPRGRRSASLISTPLGILFASDYYPSLPFPGSSLPEGWPTGPSPA